MCSFIAGFATVASGAESRNIILSQQRFQLPTSRPIVQDANSLNHRSLPSVRSRCVHAYVRVTANVIWGCVGLPYIQTCNGHRTRTTLGTRAFCVAWPMPLSQSSRVVFISGLKSRLFPIDFSPLHIYLPICMTFSMSIGSVERIVECRFIWLPSFIATCSASVTLMRYLKSFLIRSHNQLKNSSDASGGGHVRSSPRQGKAMYG